jgi:hypothetical protein
VVYLCEIIIRGFSTANNSRGEFFLGMSRIASGVC